MVQDDVKKEDDGMFELAEIRENIEKRGLN